MPSPTEYKFHKGSNFVAFTSVSQVPGQYATQKQALKRLNQDDDLGVLWAPLILQMYSYT